MFIALHGVDQKNNHSKLASTTGFRNLFGRRVGSEKTQFGHDVSNRLISSRRFEQYSRLHEMNSLEN